MSRAKYFSEIVVLFSVNDKVPSFLQGCNIAILFPFTARELGCNAFGKVFLADAMGIVAFDPRGSTKRRFGGCVRRNHYLNNNKMTKVAVKTLKGILSNDGCFCHCRSSCRRRT